MRPLYWTRVIIKEPIVETRSPTTPDSPDWYYRNLIVNR